MKGGGAAAVWSVSCPQAPPLASVDSFSVDVGSFLHLDTLRLSSDDPGGSLIHGVCFKFTCGLRIRLHFKCLFYVTFRGRNRTQIFLLLWTVNEICAERRMSVSCKMFATSFMSRTGVVLPTVGGDIPPSLSAHPPRIFAQSLCFHVQI